jgi:hypothetical protein
MAREIINMEIVGIIGAVGGSVEIALVICTVDVVVIRGRAEIDQLLFGSAFACTVDVAVIRRVVEIDRRFFRSAFAHLGRLDCNCDFVLIADKIRVVSAWKCSTFAATSPRTHTMAIIGVSVCTAAP